MKKRFGFTLIEVMVVMAIIAVLATAGISSYSWYVQRASDINKIALAYELDAKTRDFIGDHNGRVPRLNRDLYPDPNNDIIEFSNNYYPIVFRSPSSNIFVALSNIFEIPQAFAVAPTTTMVPTTTAVAVTNTTTKAFASYNTAGKCAFGSQCGIIFVSAGKYYAWIVGLHDESRTTNPYLSVTINNTTVSGMVVGNLPIGKPARNADFQSVVNATNALNAANPTKTIPTLSVAALTPLSSDEGGGGETELTTIPPTTPPVPTIPPATTPPVPTIPPVTTIPSSTTIPGSTTIPYTTGPGVTMPPVTTIPSETNPTTSWNESSTTDYGTTDYPTTSWGEDTTEVPTTSGTNMPENAGQCFLSFIDTPSAPYGYVYKCIRAHFGDFYGEWTAIPIEMSDIIAASTTENQYYGNSCNDDSDCVINEERCDFGVVDYFASVGNWILSFLGGDRTKYGQCVLYAGETTTYGETSSGGGDCSNYNGDQSSCESNSCSWDYGSCVPATTYYGEETTDYPTTSWN